MTLTVTLSIIGHVAIGLLTGLIWIYRNARSGNVLIVWDDTVAVMLVCTFLWPVLYVVLLAWYLILRPIGRLVEHIHELGAHAGEPPLNSHPDAKQRDD